MKRPIYSSIFYGTAFATSPVLIATLRTGSGKHKLKSSFSKAETFADMIKRKRVGHCGEKQGSRVVSSRKFGPKGKL